MYKVHRTDVFKPLDKVGVGRTKLQDSCMFNFGELHQIKDEQEWIICVKTKL